MRRKMSRWSLTIPAVTVLAGLSGAAAGDGGSAQQLHRIVIEDFSFIPTALTARQGDSVEWVNRDIAPHTATAESGGWDSGSLRKQQSFRLVLDHSGTITYRCIFHPQMRASITVAP